MRKMVQMLVALMMLVLSTQVAFANIDKATVVEGSDLNAVHRMAAAVPLYTQVKGAPTLNEVSQTLYAASAVAHNVVVLSYDMVAQNIMNDTHVNIKTLDRRQSVKVFKENVAKYADAYVVTTVANNSRTIFFFDVYKAGTNELMYTYEIAENGGDKDDVGTYLTMTQQFYKNFERSAQDQIRQREKAARDAEKKAAKEAAKTAAK
jgi:hypothetical protein